MPTNTKHIVSQKIVELQPDGGNATAGSDTPEPRNARALFKRLSRQIADSLRAVELTEIDKTEAKNEPAGEWGSLRGELLQLLDRVEEQERRTSHSTGAQADKVAIQSESNHNSVTLKREDILLEQVSDLHMQLVDLVEDLRVIGATPGMSDAFYEKFNAHAIHKVSLDARQEDALDAVSVEIARDVKIFWADRHKYPGQTWTANPSVFIEFVYQRWRSANTLARRHLAHDKKLYAAYALDISRHPERDLKLPTEERVQAKDDADRGKRIREKNRKRMAVRRQGTKPSI